MRFPSPLAPPTNAPQPLVDVSFGMVDASHGTAAAAATAGQGRGVAAANKGRGRGRGQKRALGGGLSDAGQKEGVAAETGWEDPDNEQPPVDAASEPQPSQDEPGNENTATTCLLPPQGLPARVSLATSPSVSEITGEKARDDAAQDDAIMTGGPAGRSAVVAAGLGGTSPGDRDGSPRTGKAAKKEEDGVLGQVRIRSCFLKEHISVGVVHVWLVCLPRWW